MAAVSKLSMERGSGVRSSSAQPSSLIQKGTHSTRSTRRRTAAWSWGGRPLSSTCHVDRRPEGNQRPLPHSPGSHGVNGGPSTWGIVAAVAIRSLQPLRESIGRTPAEPPASRAMRRSAGEHRQQSQPSCGRTTDSSGVGVLLRWRRNERQAGAELVDDLLDGERSFDGHGRGRSIRAARASRRYSLTPSSPTQRRAVSARRARPIFSRLWQPGDLERVV